MRIIGVALILFGLVLCLTIIAAPVGIFVIIVGLTCVVFGGGSRAVQSVDAPSGGGVLGFFNANRRPRPKTVDVPRTTLRREESLPPQRRPEPRAQQRREPSLREPSLREPSLGEPGAAAPPEQRTPPKPRIVETMPRLHARHHAYDRAAWEALIAVDDDIARIAKALSPYGEKYIDQFAAAYLVIEDKEFLPMIINKILAKAKRDFASGSSAA